ncbi:Protein kinase C and casein kinase substrate in neurons protein 1 [Holothuria leucospilota]|uniref:Protein kinase C and casein kinase substrate in neurons protein 1 n=1 Tax=Holothuria leucospilota TaxID=206669 RepID=A0A9Q0YM19_HOLLE|nr:Protein kinase C and casein kinase substrate in neurons protein 1 [Holothuria leucospilota]
MSVHSADHATDFSLDSQKSFWEVGQYRRTVKRLDDGYEMCNKLMMLLQERAEIEKKYAKSLKQWSKKWNEIIEKGPEYGTNKSAWKATLTEADRRHDEHRDICTRLNGEVVASIKSWQKENYHKKMMNGFKETIDLEEGFRKAQKHWAALLKKAHQSQKNYYACCKAEKTAELQEKAAEGDSTLSPDQVKKIQDKRDKCTQDTNKAKDKYESSIEDINEHNPRYIEDMTVQFKKAQDYERARLKFFKEALIATHKVLDLSVNEKFAEIYTDFMNTLQNSDSEKDLKWWSANHGINMSMNWPAFEEYSEQVHAITKKPSKGNVGGTGGDGVVVASFKSTSEFSNQDYNDPAYNTNSPASPEDENNDFAYDAEEDDDALMNKPGVQVKALYDYDGVEEDELSFHAGDIFVKLEDEDEQGWCKGRINDQIGLYPANYAAPI